MVPRGRALPVGSGVAEADVWGQPDRKQEVEKASIFIDRLRTPAMPLDPWLEGGRQKKQQPSAAVYLGQESSNTEWQQEQEEGATCIEEKKSGRNREKEK